MISDSNYFDDDWLSTIIEVDNVDVVDNVDIDQIDNFDSNQFDSNRSKLALENFRSIVDKNRNNFSTLMENELIHNLITIRLRLPLIAIDNN